MTSKHKYYIGIDPSLTATGLVMIDDTGEIVDSKLVSTEKNIYINADQRNLDILKSISFIKNVHHLDIVYIEGLSYMSQSTSLFERCGLLYMITAFLFKNDIRYQVIPPKTLKKQITNNGNATKQDVINSIFKKYKIKHDNDNLADAHSLAILALSDSMRST